MWFFRRLLRVRWTDRRTNEDVMNELGVTRKVLTMIRQRKLRNASHALRNINTDLVSSVFQGKMEIRRNRGRPLTSLLDNITSTSGLKIHGVIRASQDREKWGAFVETSSAVTTTDYGDADR